MVPTDDDLTTVATFTNTAEAQLARERLENEGVVAFVIEGVTGGTMPYLMQGGGVHLQVRNEDLEKAKEILGPV
jgi:hypothetical protein